MGTIQDLIQSLNEIYYKLSHNLWIMENRRKIGVRMPIDESMIEYFIKANKYIKMLYNL